MFKPEWFEVSEASRRYTRIQFDLYHLENKHAECLRRLTNTRSNKIARELEKRLNRYTYELDKLYKELKELQLLELITPKG